MDEGFVKSRFDKVDKKFDQVLRLNKVRHLPSLILSITGCKMVLILTMVVVVMTASPPIAMIFSWSTGTELSVPTAMVFTPLPLMVSLGTRTSSEEPEPRIRTNTLKKLDHVFESFSIIAVHHIPHV